MEGSSGFPTRFVTGLVFGAALGLMGALLLTPRSGSELRHQLSERARERGAAGRAGAPAWEDNAFGLPGNTIPPPPPPNLR